MNHNELLHFWNTASKETLEDMCYNCIVYTEANVIDMYDNMLDECYGVVKIGGYEYYHSHAFKLVDEIAYQQGFNNYIDTLECIELMDNGSPIYINQEDMETYIEQHKVAGKETNNDTASN